MRSRATAHQAGRADRREERREIHRREQGTQPRLMDNVHPLPRLALQIAFDRLEMNRILDLYGRMVAAGHWRDYAIDLDADAAVFSAFRRAAERPEIRIEKRPQLRHRQGMWALVGEAGIILKRGHDIAKDRKSEVKGKRVTVRV